MNPWGDDDTFFQACWYHLRPRMRDEMWITALSLTSCVTFCQFILTLLCFNILFSEIKYLMKLSGSLKNEQADMWSRGWCRTSALWVCTVLVPSFLPHDFQWIWGIIVRYGISCLYNSYACCSSWLSYNIDIIKLFQFKHMEQLRGDLLNIKKKKNHQLFPPHSLIVWLFLGGLQGVRYTCLIPSMQSQGWWMYFPWLSFLNDEKYRWCQALVTRDQYRERALLWSLFCSQWQPRH